MRETPPLTSGKPCSMASECTVFSSRVHLSAGGIIYELRCSVQKLRKSNCCCWGCVGYISQRYPEGPLTLVQMPCRNTPLTMLSATDFFRSTFWECASSSLSAKLWDFFERSFVLMSSWPVGCAHGWTSAVLPSRAWHTDARFQRVEVEWGTGCQIAKTQCLKKRNQVAVKQNSLACLPANENQQGRQASLYVCKADWELWRTPNFCAKCTGMEKNGMLCAVLVNFCAMVDSLESKLKAQDRQQNLFFCPLWAESLKI